MKRTSQWMVTAAMIAATATGAMAKKPPPVMMPPAPVERPPSDALEGEVQRIATSSSPGARRVGDFMRGAGDKNSHMDWYVPLEAGSCYFFVGVAGPGIEFLSLYLWDPANKRMTENRAKSPQATMAACVTFPGPHHVQAKVGKGMGEYRVGVYRTGASGMPAAPVAVAVAAPPPPPPPPPAPPRATPPPPPPVYHAPPPPPPQPVYHAPPPPPPQPVYHAPPPPPPAAAPPPSPGDTVSSTTTKAAGIAGGFKNALGGFSMSSSSTTTRTTSTTTSSSSSSGGGGSGRYQGQDGCDGDWHLGQTPMVNSRNPPGIECNNPNAPTNCPTGMYISLRSQGKCYCIARCSEYNSNPAEGAACTADGSWVCNHYQSLSTTNHSVFCAPSSWHLCTK